jgi:hypothetical protein
VSNPEEWIGLGFVSTAANAAPDVIADMGPIDVVCPQIAFGMSPPENDPGLDDAIACMGRCLELGLDVAGWAWCAYPELAWDEATYHAGVALTLGLERFVANMEEPYDAHGNSQDARMWAPDRYADAFRAIAPQVELGVTTTPRWASSGNELRAAGATIMPQAFTGEVAEATIPVCVDHAKSWGWPTDRIRPLVQVYKTNGQRPDAAVYNADAALYSVGVVPYTLEQAFDGEGTAMIRELSPSITRPPVTAAVKPPPDLPFARALYPPDAAAKGKKPSKDGPDVEAVKRAISRAGYWRWQTFDRVYSNGFAHGRSGDGPGIEGFQADHVLDPSVAPTGWYGSASHEALRCHLIAPGLPHAGEWAFDAYAIDLYRQAT